MKILIIGAGAVGKALGAMIKEGGHDLAFMDNNGQYHLKPQTVDIVHITFPMLEEREWAAKVNYWLDDYPCTYLIIESSIIPQALQHIDHPNIIYSPIRANEATMKEEIQTQPKFWASVDQLTRESWLEIKEYFTLIYPQGHQEFECAESLAFGKMLEVVDFGLQIMFAQQVQRECEEHGWMFEEAYIKYRQGSEYGADYTKVKPTGVPTKWIPRGIFRPGVIGGKCVIQDAQLLQDAGLLESLMEDLISKNACFGLGQIIDKHKEEIQEKLWKTKQ